MDMNTGIKKMSTVRIAVPAALFMAAALMFTVGCTRHNQGIEPDEDGDFISFATITPKTRSGAGDSMTDTDERLRQEPFGIYGLKSVDGKSNLANVFIGSDAQEVGWGVSGGAATNPIYGWTYTPKRKWEYSMYYTFRAFWPYRAEINSASNATRLGIEYKSTTENYDLLVAYATRYPLEEGIGTVPMRFHHALSGVRFEVKYKDGSAKGLKDYVTRFYLKGLYSVGYMIYGQRQSGDDVEKIEWILSDNTFDREHELFDWSGRREFSTARYATEENLTATVFDGDQVVFVIPQTFSPDTDKTTTANFYTEGAGDALQTVNIPKTELKPGKIYTFTLVIHSSYVTVNIDIKDWDVIQSNVDINL